jgi:hypothetical protein
MGTLTIIKEELEFEKAAYIKTFKAQGHTATGKTENSFEIVMNQTSDNVTGSVYVSDVALIQNYGIKANRIPYGSGTGAKTSKMIQGLIEHWKFRKGLSDKEALGAAIATAKKWKKEGMHTVASRRFSITGERINALSNQFQNIDSRLEARLDGLVLESYNKL